MNGFESMTIAAKRAESERLKVEVEKWKADQAAKADAAKKRAEARAAKADGGLPAGRHPWAPRGERKPPTPPDKVYSKPRGAA